MGLEVDNQYINRVRVVMVIEASSCPGRPDPALHGCPGDHSHHVMIDRAVSMALITQAL